MEPLKQITNVLTGTKSKIVEYIPYQKCPICEGTGIIITITTIYTKNTCDVCNGTKIIPMHRL